MHVPMNMSSPEDTKDEEIKTSEPKKVEDDAPPLDSSESDDDVDIDSSSSSSSSSSNSEEESETASPVKQVEEEEKKEPSLPVQLPQKLYRELSDCEILRNILLNTLYFYNSKEKVESVRSKLT
jgi:hypothetical protein